MNSKKYSFGDYKVITYKKHPSKVTIKIKRDNKIVCGFYHENDKIHELTPIIKEYITELEK